MKPETDTTKVHNPISVLQPGEQVICEIKRHPFGMMTIFAGCAALLIILALVIYVVLPRSFSGTTGNQVLLVGTAIFLLVAILILGFVIIANKIYWGNRWIITSDSVTQINQYSLFDKQSSQLSMGNIEDVTAEQKGIFPQMLNYGELRVETAGERSKFMFIYCPNPNYYAQQILNARERFEQFKRSSEIQSIAQQIPQVQAAQTSEPQIPEENVQQ